jgi:hypothetical protein
MSKFVNYSKRGFTLPPGCKDLIDLLEPWRRRPGGSKAISTTPAPQIREEHFRSAGLSQVERYVSMLVSCSGELFMLMIIIRDDRFPVILYRTQRESAVVLHLSAEDAHIDQTIRSFLGQLGVEPLHRLEVPDAFRALIYMLPADTSHITGLVTGLLRGVYGLSDVAGLDFRYYEIETAA